MSDAISEFVRRWKPSGGSEMANFPSFAGELTRLLGVEPPKPATSDGQNNDYRFERPVTFTHTGKLGRGRIDLYRRGCFILEAKQGADAEPAPTDQLSLLSGDAITQKGHGKRGSARWDDTMLRARNQADGYARAVAKEDGWPPFLLIVDVGHVIEVYADFSRLGQGYTQFPDGNRYRITLDDLHNPDVRARLTAIWNDPLSLDPARISAAVTRKVAGHLAELGKSFEGQGHAPEDVATFLMRCLFTMFAEDVALIPEGSFSAKLTELRGHPQHAQPTLQSLWHTMNTGGFSTVLSTDLKRFNGGLFKNATALPLNALQLGLLIDAASHNWREVEPAIFGTLLERALDKRQRHKLGAHYTPRAYVDRLVVPTVIEPLRADWQIIQTSVQRLTADGRQDDARATVAAFHRRLCDIRVLDPACGSGNFLYVALELMKRLEGEVIALLRDLGQDQAALGLAGHTVDPHQFLGLELNPWAAAVAELVLWIGYLQWHFRTHGKASPAEPVLRDFKNIENRDAVLDWDARRERRDANGALVTRWDGIGTIEHNVTGERVPDPAARMQVWDYTKPRPAKWPEADFIIGNPPFIGASRMRDALGDGYTEAIRAAYPKVPDSADFVMFWWEKAALAARAYAPAKGKGCRRFGLITTNSLRQTFNRKVLEPHLTDPTTPLGLIFAIPDHPWVDAGDGAAVRIAMTVAEKGRSEGRLFTVATESKTADANEGRDVVLNLVEGTIFADLRVGADVAGAKALKANLDIAGMGVKLHGAGFIISQQQAAEFSKDSPKLAPHHIRQFINGRDLTQLGRRAFVIDFFGLPEASARSLFPQAFQHVMDTVKPERDQNQRETRKRNWWLFGETISTFRPAFDGLARYIATTRTSKHRTFQFVPNAVLHESKVVAVAVEDAWIMAVLSSSQHVLWSFTAGGMLGVGNDPTYNHSDCLYPFPFPTPSDPLRTRLRQLGEDLDAHRKRQQAQHPKLTLTAMYNCLEKLRAGDRIEGRDKETYDQGLIGILRDLHDQIDAAVAEAYGWPATLTADEILHNLVALNRTRSLEEAGGQIRWLRPDYQNPAGQTASAQGEQTAMDIGPTTTTAKTPWPKTMPEQIAAVRAALAGMGEATPDQIARQFSRARTTSVQPLLESLAALGYATRTEGGRFLS